MIKNTINRVDDLNKSSVSCDPCKKEVQRIKRKMTETNMNKLKIDGIKKIVNSMFQVTKNEQQKN